MVTKAELYETNDQLLAESRRRREENERLASMLDRATARNRELERQYESLRNEMTEVNDRQRAEINKLRSEQSRLQGQNERLVTTLDKATARNKQLEEHYTKLREYVIAGTSGSAT